jgi:hypothetical protein
MIGGGLYWSLRPAVLSNPSMSAYHAPAPPPVLARKSDAPDEAERLRLSIASAAAENQRLGLGHPQESTTALAAAGPAPQQAGRVRTASRPKQKRRRIQQARNREEFLVRRSWGPTWASRDSSFGFWFR